MLRAGQQRGEPAAHRPAAERKVVDEKAAVGGKLPAEAPDEISRAGRSVRALTQASESAPTRIASAAVTRPSEARPPR